MIFGLSRRTPQASEVPFFSMDKVVALKNVNIQKMYLSYTCLECKLFILSIITC